MVTPVVVPNGDENEDDDDDENGDFIDVPPISQPHPVNTSTPAVDFSKDLPNLSAGEKTTKKGQKKKETAKKKKTPKSSKRKRRETEEQPASELDDLVNDLEMAISQADQPTQQAPISHSISFFSDEEEDESRRSQSSQPHVVQPKYQPTSLPQPIVPRTISARQKPTPQPTSITFTRELSTLSDDETDDRRQPALSTPVFTPVVELSPKPSSIVTQRPVTRLQGRLRASNDLRTSISMLSEDDDHQPSQVSSPAVIQFYARSPSPVYEDPPPITEPIQTTSVSSLPPDDDLSRPTSQSDIDPLSTTDSPTIALPEQSASSGEEIIPLQAAEQLPESSKSLPEKAVERTVSSKPTEKIVSSKPVDTLDQHQIDLVLRLLHVLRQVPARFEPLRLSRRRSRPKPISGKKSPVQHVSADNVSKTIETPPIIIEETQVDQPKDLRPESAVEQRRLIEDELAKPVEEGLPESVEDELAKPVEEGLPESVEDELAKPVEEELAKPMEEELAKPVEEVLPESVEDELAKPMEEELAEPVEKELVNPVEDELAEPVEEELAKPVEEGLAKPMEEELAKSVEDEQSQTDQDTTMNEVVEDQQQRVDETAMQVPSTIEHPQELPVRFPFCR